MENCVGLAERSLLAYLFGPISFSSQFVERSHYDDFKRNIEYYILHKVLPKDKLEQ